MTLIYRPFSAALGLCVVMLFNQAAFSQTIADTLLLKEVEVVATRIEQPLEYQPTRVGVIDSMQLRLMQDVSIDRLLASHSSLFIKSQGPGSMATASQRGLSSEQIQVLWEGIPINSPLLGQTDLSLLPASFFSEVQVSSGTPSSAFGGGSLSGALYLGSDWEQRDYFSARQGTGSFGQWQTSVQSGYTTDNLRFSVRGLYEYSENDFQYYNRAYDQLEKRRHNRTERMHVMASLGGGDGSSPWKSVVWIADSKNQIPGNVLQDDSKARQEDQSLRWLSTYRTHWGTAEVSIRNFLERVELDYFDSQLNTRSLSTHRRWLVSSNIRSSVGQHLLMKGEVSTALTGVDNGNYVSSRGRRQLSILTNPEMTFLDHRMRIYPALRMDAYSDFGAVLSPSLGVNYELRANSLFVRGQLSRDFNPPTFNALYWGQGGDPNLKAERSNTAEVGFILTPRYLPVFSSVELTGYYSEVDNGIRWYPGPDGVYSPSNVEQLRTRGVEIHTESSLPLPADWQVRAEQSGSLNRTEITKPRFPGDAAVGHQARYTPKWKYQASVSLQKGMGSALLQYRAVGRRFTTDTEDRRDSLDPYQLLDLRLQAEREIWSFNISVQGGINNLFNTNYEIIQWYAMPQRNFSFSLTATYHL
ncbi:TonB-dependent receptor plug domain-containing protein [Fodinibius sediminis]|uniref:Outer membrane cobalamin receptor protein n=1 Tax=Fodinibius sediminis TaxID=1214077 RepID=A0A521B7Q4_9BACT|nr:TonB-dependent receptor [Fodinibius sediminis]SMO43124.1 Outer membrane cobalamin receptor protein [Fodinibius sediminis]